MGNLSIFFNTKIENSGTLAAIGDFGLTPVRYLFNGNDVWALVREREKLPTPIKLTPSFEEESSLPLRMLKAIGAIILLVPGLLLSVVKLGAYFSEEFRTKHQYTKLCLISTTDPCMIIDGLPTTLQCEDGSMIDASKNIETQDELTQAIESAKKEASNQPQAHPRILAIRHLSLSKFKSDGSDIKEAVSQGNVHPEWISVISKTPGSLETNIELIQCN